MALPLEEPPAPELPLALELPPDLLDDDLLDDFLLLAVFLADSYSERLSCPSLFLSYWVKPSASPETVRASSMLTAPLLSESALRKLGHLPAEEVLEDPDAPFEDPFEDPEAPAEPAAPDEPEAPDDFLLLSEDLPLSAADLLLSAANVEADTADNANTNVAATADFIIPFIRILLLLKYRIRPGATTLPGDPVLTYSDCRYR